MEDVGGDHDGSILVVVGSDGVGAIILNAHSVSKPTPLLLSAAILADNACDQRKPNSACCSSRACGIITARVCRMLNQHASNLWPPPPPPLALKETVIIPLLCCEKWYCFHQCSSGGIS